MMGDARDNTGWYWTIAGTYCMPGNFLNAFSVLDFLYKQPTEASATRAPQKVRGKAEGKDTFILMQRIFEVHARFFPCRC